MKKLIALMLSVLIAAAAFPMGVLAEEVQDIPAEEAVVEAEPQTAAEEAEEPEADADDTAESEEEPEEAAEPETGDDEAEEPVTEDEETAEVFTGSLFAKIVNEDPIVEGDTVLLRATVSNANLEYTLSWQRLDTREIDPEWEHISGRDLYEFTATAQTPFYRYRVRVLVADQVVLTSKEFQITLAEPEEEQELEVTEETVEPEETTEPEETEAVEEPEAVEEVTEEVTEETAEEDEAAEEVAEEVTKPEETETVEEPQVTEEETEPAENEAETVPAPAKQPSAELPEVETPEDEEPVYVYERDEDGALVLDENGDPIVTVLGDAEIPATYQRNENGELVLDENGDPIPTQTVPQDAVKIMTLDDVLSEDRKIDLYASWNNETPALGGTVTFVAVLKGYDNLVYDVQWQESADNTNWTNIQREADPEMIPTRYSVIVTEDNYANYWRVQVIITGYIVEEAE